MNSSSMGRTFSKCTNSSRGNTIYCFCCKVWFLKLTFSFLITEVRNCPDFVIEVEIAESGDISVSNFDGF